MSGRDLVLELQKRRPETKVLFTSGYPSDAVVRHGIAEGDFELLAKPLTATSLAQHVRKALDVQ